MKYEREEPRVVKINWINDELIFVNIWTKRDTFIQVKVEKPLPKSESK